MLLVQTAPDDAGQGLRQVGLLQEIQFGVQLEVLAEGVGSVTAGKYHLQGRFLGYRLLNLRRHPIPKHRLAPRDLLQRRLAALVVKFLEAVEAVAAVPSPAGRRHVAELLGQLQYSTFTRITFCSCFIALVSF